MDDISISSPLQGRLIPLADVNDPAFSGGVLGRGAAVAEPFGRVFAPFDAEVTALFDTHHAIGLHSEGGVDLLIHVGINTVNLQGKFFAAHVAQGDRVKRGQLLLTFDADAVAAAGYDTTTPVVVTNAASCGRITVCLGEAAVTSAPGDNA